MVQQGDAASGSRPNLLLAVLYRQATGFPGGLLLGGSVCCCGLPDHAIGYEGVLSRTEDLFRQLYPEDLLFPLSPEGDEPDDGEGSDEESVAALEAALRKAQMQDPPNDPTFDSASSHEHPSHPASDH